MIYVFSVSGQNKRAPNLGANSVGWVDAGSEEEATGVAVNEFYKKNPMENYSIADINLLRAEELEMKKGA